MESNLFERYEFTFDDVFDVTAVEETEFILTAASIANDVQVVWQLLQSTIVSDDTPIAEAQLSEATSVYYLRLAVLHLHAAALFLDGNSRLFQRINPQVYNKFLRARRRDKLVDALRQSTSSRIRNTIAHYALIDRQNPKIQSETQALFERTILRHKDDKATIIIHGSWTRFTFLDELLFTMGKWTLDTSMSLTDGMQMRLFISLYAKGLKLMDKICTQLVVDYIKKRVDHAHPLDKVEDGDSHTPIGEQTVLLPGVLVQSVKRSTGKSSLDEAVRVAVEAFLSRD